MRRVQAEAGDYELRRDGLHAYRRVIAGFFLPEARSRLKTFWEGLRKESGHIVFRRTMFLRFPPFL